LAGQTTAQVVVMANGLSSASHTVPLTGVAPAIFKPGILNQDGTRNSASNPAGPGSTIVIYATGLASPGSGPISAHIAGRDVFNPVFAGPAPGTPGVQLVKLVVPVDIPPGLTSVQVCAVGRDPTQRICSTPAGLAVQ
jgi:uncharacterized protein (TIGR03437 family)